MKRMIFAVILLFFLLSFNFFCLYKVEKIKTEAGGKLDSIYESIISGNSQKTASKCEEFTDYWLSEQHALCLMVRHDLLDRITVSVLGFVPLAVFGEKGELASEVSRCKILLEGMWNSERPLLRNIF